MNAEHLKEVFTQGIESIVEVFMYFFNNIPTNQDKSVSLEEKEQVSDSAESDDDLLESLLKQNQKPQSTLSAITIIIKISMKSLKVF